MKKILLVFVAVLAMVSCNKELTTRHEPVLMTYEELSKVIGSHFAYEVFDRSGRTESVYSSGVARTVQKKIKNNATVAVWFDDLTLTRTGSIMEYSTIPDADWGGVTKFLSQTSSDGAIAIWDCGRYWNRTLELVPPSVVCTDPATAGTFLRAFTSNSTTGDVHISNWVNG